MMRINSTRRVVRSVALLAFVGWSTVAVADELAARGSGIAPTIPSRTRLVHIPLQETTAIAAQKGWLQEEFAKYNAKTDLVLSTSYSGATVAALLDRGDLHFVTLMMNMSLQYRAQGFDTVVIWGSGVVNPRRAQTIVLKESDIQSVPQLKGQTVAASVLSCPYYASMEALRSQGVTVDTDLQKGDSRFINISGAAATSAFLAGRFQGFALHPASSTTASLFIQDQIRTLTTAIPDGIYVNSGGRSMQFASRPWVNENPDLVKAFIAVQDRVVRWLASDNGAHFDEAASITSRALRIPKSVALFALRDKSETAWNFGETEANILIENMKKFQKYQLSVKDPTFTKANLTDRQIEALVDRRFFSGGEYFVDVGEKKTSGARGDLLNGGAESSGTKLALAKGQRLP